MSSKVLFLKSLKLAISSSRILTLGLGFLVIPFLPASNLFFRVGFVVAERVLYLPSVGFCVLLTFGLGALSRHTKKKVAWGWGDNSVGETLAVQACRLRWSHSTGVGHCHGFAHNPKLGSAEPSRSWELTV